MYRRNGETHVPVLSTENQRKHRISSQRHRGLVAPFTPGFLGCSTVPTSTTRLASRAVRCHHHCVRSAAPPIFGSTIKDTGDSLHNKTLRNSLSDSYYLLQQFAGSLIPHDPNNHHRRHRPPTDQRVIILRNDFGPLKSSLSFCVEIVIGSSASKRFEPAVLGSDGTKIRRDGSFCGTIVVLQNVLRSDFWLPNDSSPLTKVATIPNRD